MSRILGLSVLAGCHLVFPLDDPPIVVDDGPLADAFRPLVPPDGATTCRTAPDFATWTFVPRTLLGAPPQLDNLTFRGPDRVILAGNGTLFETTLDGPPIELTELALPDGSGIRFPGSTPSGEMIWFNRFSQNATPSVGNYYAIRGDAGWIATRAEFGIAAFQLIPSNVGFYSGAGRMVVSIEPSPGAGLRLVELETLDGLTWNQLDTLPFSTGTPPAFNASISADGCFVLFRTGTSISVTQRDQTGNFQAPVKIIGLDNAVGAAINTTNDRIWALRNFMIVEGTP